jgi:AraC-like DNA-binding protein
MAPIDEALKYLESHELEENTSYTKVAEIFSVSRHTLARRHKGITQSMTTKHQQQRKITPQAEAELVRYIQSLSDRHMPPTRNMIQNFASKIAREEVSETWVTRFLNRHPDDIISKWATGMDSARHQAESKGNYRL